MRERVLLVKMAEGVVATAPHIIQSVGLGSCVALTLYDRNQKIGGLAHIMLPSSNGVRGHRPPYQCADTAIPTLLQEMRSRGAIRQAIIAKVFGGARMFADYEASKEGIGDENIKSIRSLLKGQQIPLIGEDTGGNHGRSIEFHLSSGKVVVKAFVKEDRVV